MIHDDIMYRDIKSTLDAVFPLFNLRKKSTLPNCDQLNKHFKHYNNNNKNLFFAQQDDNLLHPKLGYEERIYEHGVIATRSNNWHDFFNAMVWHNFPKTKSAINAIHYQQIQLQNDSKRSRKRDILTLFDECGVIILAKSVHLELIRKHDWYKLFIENKSLWLNQEIKIITFGHAMYEKYLNPYIGMTAKALLVDENQFDIDAFIASKILNHKLLISKEDLSPLPVLGIPGWHKNQNNSFYANKQYFR
ncbi:MAG: DUF3025 domain-containing protein [Marinicellaceae bacterium]